MSETTPDAPAPETTPDEPFQHPVTHSNEAPDEQALPPEVETKPDEPKDDKPAEPDDKKPVKEPKGDWRDERLRQTVAKRHAAEARAEAAEKELQELRAKLNPPADQPGTEQSKPPQDFEAAVNERAERIAADKLFNDDCNRVAKQGADEFGADFGASLATLWEATEGLDPRGAFTPRGRAMIDAAMETDEPHAVLHYLGQNPDEAIRIAGLQSDVKRGAAIAKVAAQLAAAPPPPAPPPQSSAPPPISPLRRGGGNPEPRPDGTQEDYTKWYEAQRKKVGR